VGINKSVKCPGLGPKKKANAPPQDHLESNTAQNLINHNKKVSLIIKTIKAGYHIIATIAAIAGKNVQQSLWSYGYHTSATVALTSFHNDREEWFLYDCNDCDHRDCSNRTETSLYFQYFSVVYPCVYPRSRCSFALMPLISNMRNCVHDSSFWFNYSFIYVIWPAQFMCLF